MSPDGIARPLLAAALVSGVCLAGLAGWTAQAPVAGAVLAQGRIAVEGSSKSVQHLEGGLVGEILVADGDRVMPGQPLLRLDVTDARAALAALTSERAALSARAVRLAAELRAEAPDFAAAGPAAEAAAAREAAIFEARSRERAAERAMLDGTLERLGARSSAIAAELAGVEAQAALVAEDAAASRQLAERGVTTRVALRDVERSLAGLRGTVTALTAELAEAAAAESEARLERAGAETRLVSALAEEQAQVAARLARIAPEIAAIETRLSRFEIVAPVAGTVVDLSVATIGGVLAPGAPLLRIVPTGATLVAEGRVAPGDRERLAEGMTAEVRLPGVETLGETGIAGTVTGISADRIAGGAEDEEHYRLIVTLDAAEPGRLAPGLPVTVVVPTTPRSVVDYLLSPLRDAIARSLREV
jgi:HlyD family type I secretion membrane fusion protein